MKVAVVNPNATEAMTAAVVAGLAARRPDLAFASVTATDGPRVIDSRATYDAAAAAAPSLLARVPSNADAIVLACFGDPGLEAMRSSASVPVLGLAECALQAAAARGDPYALITLGEAWRALLRACAVESDTAALLQDVHAIPGNGAQLVRNPDAFRAAIESASTRAADEGARTIILAGAAFAGLRFTLDARLALLDTLDAVAKRLTR